MGGGYRRCQGEGHRARRDSSDGADWARGQEGLTMGDGQRRQQPGDGVIKRGDVEMAIGGLGSTARRKAGR